MIARRSGTIRSARPGISLIEVLLATAIFLMSIAALGILLNTGSDAALEAYRTNLCSQLARAKMAELEAGVGDVAVTSGGSGTFADRPTYNWEVISTPAAVANAYDVTIRVWVESGNRPTEVSLSQIVIDPTLLNNAAPLQAPTTTGTPP
ncbi:MAG: hypothetical protein MUF18_14505 [Fimbriiglobus sp.]|nr:hypothetical protein [Fimbriiglobus sp.]